MKYRRGDGLPAHSGGITCVIRRHDDGCSPSRYGFFSLLQCGKPVRNVDPAKRIDFLLFASIPHTTPRKPMSAAHLHLILNHIPLLGLVFGAVLLAYGLWRGAEDVQKASLGLLAVAGLSAIAVYLTGEPAEGVVEGLAGVSHDALEAHEAWGLYALIGGIATGGLALGTLLLGWVRERLGRGAVVLTLVVALLTSGVIGYTANLGGKVSHPELRAATTDAQPAGEPVGPEDVTEESEHEEED